MKYIKYALGFIAFLFLVTPGSNGDPSILASLVTEMFQLDALGDKITNFPDYIKR